MEDGGPVHGPLLVVAFVPALVTRKRGGKRRRGHQGSAPKALKAGDNVVLSADETGGVRTITKIEKQ